HVARPRGLTHRHHDHSRCPNAGPGTGTVRDIVPETPVPPASLTGAVPPGYVLAGRYALVRLIARGGMADVWEAKDTLLERQVAVKILHPHLAADAGFVSRFRTEAIAAARLHHRSIVAIFDTCSDS